MTGDIYGGQVSWSAQNSWRDFDGNLWTEESWFTLYINSGQVYAAYSWSANFYEEYNDFAYGSFDARFPSATITTTRMEEPSNNVLRFVGVNNSVLAGLPFGVAVAAVDATTGRFDPSFHGSVTLSLANNPGGSTLGGTLTVGTDIMGMAMFSNLTLDKPGTGYTLQATSPGLASAMSFPFDVIAADHLVVTGQPSSQVVAGSQFDVQVSVEDASGKVDANFPGSVTLTLANNPGSSTLDGAVAVQTAPGVFDFPYLTLDKPGIGYTLQATCAGMTPVTTHPFDVMVPPDLAANALNWNSSSGGVDVTYQVGAAPVPVNTTVGFYWGGGPTLVNALPAGSLPIPAAQPVGSYTLHIDPTSLATAPIGAKYLLAVLDPQNVIAESNETNNTIASAAPTIYGIIPPIFPVPAGPTILATFTPNFGFSLQTAAHLCGYDHFNWLQVVVADPHVPDMPAGLHVPFIDPPLGGGKRFRRLRG